MSNPTKTILVFYGCAGGNGEENFVALVQGDNILQKNALPGQGLAQALSNKTEELLAAFNNERPEAIAVVTGPGSFTGLRSTIAIAQGLGIGWNIPVLGTSLHDAMGETLRGKYPFKGNELLILHHARKGYVYALGAKESLEVLSFEEALEQAAPFAGGNAVDGNLAVAGLANRYRSKGEIFPAHPEPIAIVRSCFSKEQNAKAVLPVYGEGARISKAKAMKV